MGGAEESLRRAPARRLSPAGGARGRRGALATLRGLSALREFLPTVVQVGIQDASRRQGPQDLPRTRDALCKAPRLRGRHRRDEGSFESGGRPTRPVTPLGGDPISSTPPGGTGRRSDDPPSSSRRGCRFSKPRDPFLTTFAKPFPPLE